MDSRQLMVALVFWQNFLARVKAACEDEPMAPEAVAAWWSLWSGELDQEDRQLLRHLLDELTAYDSGLRRLPEVTDVLDDIAHLLTVKYYGSVRSGVPPLPEALLATCNEAALQWLYGEYSKRTQPGRPSLPLFPALLRRKPNP